MVRYFATELPTEADDAKLRLMRQQESIRQMQMERGRRQMDKLQQLEELSRDYLGSGDRQRLNEIAALDIDRATRLQQLQSGGTASPFKGTSRFSQLGNIAYQDKIAQGMSSRQAMREAANEASAVVGAQTDPRGYMVPGMGLPSEKPTYDTILQKMEAAETPEEEQLYMGQIQQMAREEGIDPDTVPEMAADGIDQYLQGRPQTPPFFPETQTFARQDASDVMSPVAKAKRAEAAAKKGVEARATMREEATAASDQVENFKQIYDIYEGGFKGGLLAGLNFKKIELKRAAGETLNPEEQMFATNYSRIKSLSNINVAKSIKPIFGGNISDGEREFAIALQSQPMDIAEQAISKAAVQEAGALQKIRKNQAADAWEERYGAIEAKNEKGESFEAFYSKYAKKNPIMTPVFLAERGVPVPVKSKAVFESLPIGAKYINPSDGKIYEKVR